MVIKKLYAKFACKISNIHSMEPHDYTSTIERVKIQHEHIISDEEFDRLSTNLLTDYPEYLNIDTGGSKLDDESGERIFLCTVFKTEDNKKMLFIDNQGYNYARYTAYHVFELDSLNNTERCLYSI